MDLDASGEVGERILVDIVHVTGVKHIFMMFYAAVAKHECFSTHQKKSNVVCSSIHHLDAFSVLIVPAFPSYKPPFSSCIFHV